MAFWRIFTDGVQVDPSSCRYLQMVAQSNMWITCSVNHHFYALLRQGPIGHCIGYTVLKGQWTETEFSKYEMFSYSLKVWRGRLSLEGTVCTPGRGRPRYKRKTKRKVLLIVYIFSLYRGPGRVHYFLFVPGGVHFLLVPGYSSQL
jgi:hypothetical protein